MAELRQASFSLVLCFLAVSGVAGTPLIEDSGPVDVPQESVCEFQGQASYMALLLDKTGKPRCGATIISEDAVVTAASCVRSVLHGDLEVANACMSGKDRTPLLQITEIIIHEESTEDPRDGYDIAVVKFSGGGDVRPIRLPEKSAVPGETYRVLSYGQSGRLKPLDGGLFGGNLTNIDIAECNANGVEPRLDEKRLCTQSPKCKCASICPGDEGSPLVHVPRIKEQGDTLMGIASYGSLSCEQEGGYGVHTNVFFHRDWIMNAVKRT